jgi:hypothetical protein
MTSFMNPTQYSCSSTDKHIDRDRQKGPFIMHDDGYIGNPGAVSPNFVGMMTIP